MNDRCGAFRHYYTILGRQLLIICTNTIHEMCTSHFDAVLNILNVVPSYQTAFIYNFSILKVANIHIFLNGPNFNDALYQLQIVNVLC